MPRRPLGLRGRFGLESGRSFLSRQPLVWYEGDDLLKKRSATVALGVFPQLERTIDGYEERWLSVRYFPFAV